jgi:hypothetical protein
MQKQLVIVTAVLILLDLTLCQLQLLSGLYDTNLPSVFSPTTPVLQSLTTSYRLAVFYASLLIRIYFVLEIGLRFYSDPTILQSILTLLDFVVVIAAVPLKLSLNARDALVVNFFIFFRLLTFAHHFKEFFHFSSACDRNAWHQEELRKNAEVQRDNTAKDLQQVEEKLRVMMGDEEVPYDGKKSSGNISPDRFSKLSFFNA